MPPLPPPPPHLPTVVDGVRYRSRLEARWAVFFRALGVLAHYELQSYLLPSGVYRPDFWLPDLRLHAEVKPTPHDRRALARAAELAHGTGRGCALLVGLPAARAYDVMAPDGQLARNALAWPMPHSVVRAAVHFAMTARFDEAAA